ncbi:MULTISPECIES: hypothetical protein [Enterobacter]
MCAILLTGTITYGI